MRVKTKNVEERNLLLDILFKMGYVWHLGLSDESTDSKYIEKRYRQKNYPFVDINDKKSIGGCGDCDKDDFSWPECSIELFKYLTTKEIIIEDVGDYTAIIKADGIRVGCQVISFEKFQEIADAVKKFKE